MTTTDDLTEVPTITFSDGRAMPQLGFGVYQIDDDAATAAVNTALEVGYRSIDTAKVYRNETGVGRAIRESGIPRDEIFVTTKVWNDDQGHDATLRAFDASLGRLGLDAVDLYLIHWPAPRQGRALETWKALIRLNADGRARSIGVSNFREADLRGIIEATGITPVLNQIELHPRFQQRDLRAVHDRLGIVTEAWSPLGQARFLDDPTLAAIARKHGRTPAQVVLRWHLQAGTVVIPKSENPDRIAENFAITGFVLDEEDLAAMAALDAPGGRLGPDPGAFPG